MAMPFWQRCLCIPAALPREEPKDDIDDMQLAFLRGDFRPKIAPSTLIGKRVVLSGLVARPELNGRAGTVMSYEEASGRCAVMADGAEDAHLAERIKEYLKVKPENLSVVEPHRSQHGSTPMGDSGAAAGSTVPTATSGTEPLVSATTPLETKPSEPTGSPALPPPPTAASSESPGPSAQEAQMLAQHRAAQLNPGAMFAEREATLEAMPRDQAEVELRNEALLRDAKAEGNQGNLVVKDGKMVLLDEDSMGGSCERYSWGQNETEVTIKATVAKTVRSKDVRFFVTSTRIKLEVHGTPLVDGELCAKVIADESIWKIEDSEVAREAGDAKRLVTVTLTKLNPTQARGHWSCVVKGEAEIDTTQFGAQIRTFDPKDGEGMKAMFN